MDTVVSSIQTNTTQQHVIAAAFLAVDILKIESCSFKQHIFAKMSRKIPRVMISFCLLKLDVCRGRQPHVNAPNDRCLTAHDAFSFFCNFCKQGGIRTCSHFKLMALQV